MKGYWTNIKLAVSLVAMAGTGIVAYMVYCITIALIPFVLLGGIIKLLISGDDDEDH